MARELDSTIASILSRRSLLFPLLLVIDTKDNWDRKNLDKVKKSKAKYDKDNPVWAFRPTPELREWLEKERWDDSNGNPETNAALVTRKLEKLMEMEYQGY